MHIIFSCVHTNVALQQFVRMCLRFMVNPSGTLNINFLSDLYFWTYPFYVQVYNSWKALLKNLPADASLTTVIERRETLNLPHSLKLVKISIYVGAGLAVNYTDIIARLWGFDEAVDYNYQSNSCTPGRMCGHYTQVMDNSNVHLNNCSMWNDLYQKFDFMMQSKTLSSSPAAACELSQLRCIKNYMCTMYRGWDVSEE